MTFPVPSVCIAIPVLNEAENLPALIDFLRAETYPNIESIFFALAPSTDASEELIQPFLDHDPRVKVIENPEKTVAIGLNLCLYQSRADYFIRLDAHARYEFGYIARLVAAAEESGALNTGGVQLFRVENAVQLATAILHGLVTAAGLSRWRNPDFTGFTDTVYLGCYPLEVMRNIGGFSEDQKTNQDAELNQRLNNIRKNAVFQDGSVISWYAPRKTLPEIVKQYFHYGEGRALNWLTHFPVIPVRTLLPLLFTLVLLPLTVDSWLLPGALIALAVVAEFQLRKDLKGGRIYFPAGTTPTKIKAVLLTGPLLLLMCVVFCAGFLKGLFQEAHVWWKSQKSTG